MHLPLGANDPTALIGVTVSLAVTAMAAVGVLARRFLSSNRDQYKALVQPAYDRVKAVEADNTKLELRLEIALRLLRENGIDATEVLQ